MKKVVVTVSLALGLSCPAFGLTKYLSPIYPSITSSSETATAGSSYDISHAETATVFWRTTMGNNDSASVVCITELSPDGVFWYTLDSTTQSGKNTVLSHVVNLNNASARYFRASTSSNVSANVTAVMVMGSTR